MGYLVEFELVGSGTVGVERDVSACQKLLCDRFPIPLSDWAGPGDLIFARGG